MTLRDVTVPDRVWLQRWHHPVYGDRWTLSVGDRSIVTRGTEFEARQYAKERGWTVEAVFPASDP